MRPLGPKMMFFPRDISAFCKSIEQASEKNFKFCLQLNQLCGQICWSDRSAQDLQLLYLNMKHGKVCTWGSWGNRDVRLKAKKENWPSEEDKTYFKFKDRSGYIAFSLLKVQNRDQQDSRSRPFSWSRSRPRKYTFSWSRSRSRSQSRIFVNKSLGLAC